MTERQRQQGTVEVTIRPVVPPDHDALYELAVTPGIGDHWRYQGHRPTLDEFLEGLWAGVLQQSVVCEGAGGAVIGLVTAYNPDHRSGSCAIAVVEHPAHVGRGTVLLGAGLFIDQLFRDWPFRFLRIEAYDYSYAGFHSIVGTIARVDGVLVDDLLWQGAHHDKHLLSIEREQWEAHRHTFVGALLRRCTPEPTPAVTSGASPRRAAHERSTAPVPYDAFATAVATALELERCPARTESLVESVLVDSVELLRLIVIVEELAGVVEPPEALPQLSSLDDAYAYFVALTGPA